ncbi:MAG: hypothetical protein K2F66_07000 [Duncaniella sp.]|nr:hypothetical protein [Duncaniella sp.]
MLMTVTTLTSCEPDDDDFFYYNIAGRWIEVAPYDGDIYDFYNDGTGYCYYENGTYSYFEWEADNYYLTLYFEDDYGFTTTEYYSWSYQGNSLYLYPNYDTSNPHVLKPY